MQYLLEYEWVVDDRYPDSLQYTNLPGKEFMMLTVDLLHEVDRLLPVVKAYADD